MTRGTASGTGVVQEQQQEHQQEHQQEQHSIVRTCICFSIPVFAVEGAQPSGCSLAPIGETTFSARFKPLTCGGQGGDTCQSAVWGWLWA